MIMTQTDTQMPIIDRMDRESLQDSAFLLFSRWNELAAENVGVTLYLVPILLGFFTYKMALVARQSLALFSNLAEDAKRDAKP